MTAEASEVTQLIWALRDRKMTLEEVAQRFRERYWPPATPPRPDSYLEMARRSLEDPRPDVPNSYDDVVAAYDRGEITREQFDVLSDAVVDAKRMQRRD